MSLQLSHTFGGDISVAYLVYGCFVGSRRINDFLKLEASLLSRVGDIVVPFRLLHPLEAFFLAPAAKCIPHGLCLSRFCQLAKNLRRDNRCFLRSGFVRLQKREGREALVGKKNRAAKALTSTNLTHLIRRGPLPHAFKSRSLKSRSGGGFVAGLPSICSRNVLILCRSLVLPLLPT